MKIYKAIMAALIAASVLASTVTAYADPRPDPVEVISDSEEIVTEVEMEEPDYISFYCCGVWTTTDRREIHFNDDSIGYMYDDGRYVFVPMIGKPIERYDVGEFVGDIVRYQYRVYGQCIDGCPLPTARGDDDYTYFIFSREIDDYIRIFEYLYGVL